MKKTNTFGPLGRTPQGPNRGLGQSIEVPGKFVLVMVFGSKLLVKSARKAMVCSDVGTGFLQQLWEKSGGAFVLAWIRGTVLCLRTASVKWNVPGKCGPHGEHFCFFIKKEPAIMPGSETFSPSFAADIRRPFFSADVLTKCALIALHLLEEDGGVDR